MTVKHVCEHRVSRYGSVSADILSDVNLKTKILSCTPFYLDNFFLSSTPPYCAQHRYQKRIDHLGIHARMTEMSTVLSLPAICPSLFPAPIVDPPPYTATHIQMRVVSTTIVACVKHELKNAKRTGA